MPYYVPDKLNSRPVFPAPPLFWRQCTSPPSTASLPSTTSASPAGCSSPPRNEWCILAERIDWSAAGTRYAACFKSGRGHPAVPLRQAMGALIIQKRMGQKRPRPGGGDSREPVPPVLHRPSALLSQVPVHLQHAGPFPAPHHGGDADGRQRGFPEGLAFHSRTP